MGYRIYPSSFIDVFKKSKDIQTQSFEIESFMLAFDINLSSMSSMFLNSNLPKSPKT